MNDLKYLFSLVIMAILFAGCDFIGDIFQAGIWIGVIVVVIIVAIIAWIIRKFRG